MSISVSNVPLNLQASGRHLVIPATICFRPLSVHIDLHTSPQTHSPVHPQTQASFLRHVVRRSAWSNISYSSRRSTGAQQLFHWCSTHESSSRGVRKYLSRVLHCPWLPPRCRYYHIVLSPLTDEDSLKPKLPRTIQYHILSFRFHSSVIPNYSYIHVNYLTLNCDTNHLALQLNM